MIIATLLLEEGEVQTINVIIYAPITNYSDMVGNVPAYDSINATIEGGTACNCMDYGLDMCCRVMNPPF